MPFRYLRDPLFLGCVALYGVNRFLLRPLWPVGFFGAYVNDLICMPLWVPVMLWVLRRTGLRTDDALPRGYEVLIPLLLWSAWFEVVLPQAPGFQDVAFADPADLLCYSLGGLVSAAYWNGRRVRTVAGGCTPGRPQPKWVAQWNRTVDPAGSTRHAASSWYSPRVEGARPGALVPIAVPVRHGTREESGNDQPHSPGTKSSPTHFESL